MKAKKIKPNDEGITDWTIRSIGNTEKGMRTVFYNKFPIQIRDKDSHGFTLGLGSGSFKGKDGFKGEFILGTDCIILNHKDGRQFIVTYRDLTEWIGLNFNKP